jgi:hypothetical protein
MQQGSIKTLIGLIEERLRSIEVIDREDKREKRLLESCHGELRRMLLSLVPGQRHQATDTASQAAD